MAQFLGLALAIAIFALAASGKLDPVIHAAVVGSPRAIKAGQK